VVTVDRDADSLLLGVELSIAGSVVLHEAQRVVQVLELPLSPASSTAFESRGDGASI